MIKWISKDRVFIYALILSAAWHIFWISMTKIIVVSKNTPPRFSRVSFLGPILARGALEVRIKPPEHSFLEERYLADIKDIAGRNSFARDSEAGMENITDYGLNDREITPLIEKAIAGSKIEPVSVSD